MVGDVGCTNGQLQPNVEEAALFQWFLHWCRSECFADVITVLSIEIDGLVRCAPVGKLLGCGAFDPTGERGEQGDPMMLLSCSWGSIPLWTIQEEIRSTK